MHEADLNFHRFDEVLQLLFKLCMPTVWPKFLKVHETPEHFRRRLEALDEANRRRENKRRRLQNQALAD